MPKRSNTLLHGTLDALILKALSRGRQHGYGVARWIEASSDEVVQVEEGSLYPALYRMERRGWIESEWGVSELNRKAKLYSITRRGRAHLAVETERWRVFTAAVSKVLLPCEVEA
jgi:PadR family transcriptional regulator PadR